MSKPAPYQAHFRRRDPVLHAVVRRVGPFTLRPSGDRFGMLVRSIIYQQISMGAARSILARVQTLVGSERIRPELLVGRTPDELRTAGVSPQKARYLLDLAAKVHDGSVRLSHLGRLSDEEVIQELIQIKGIGRWTAQMFLIFSLGRLDVFPLDDLGVKSAVRELYAFEELPSRDELLEIGSVWSPYASIGSWYCWRYLDLARGRPPQSVQ